MSTMMSTARVIDPEERVRRFGIECTSSIPAGAIKATDGILYKAGHWRPGGEYVQKLTVKNVSLSVKKFKYQLPATRYFFLEYPEIIILSPGMFKVIDVIFRPVEHEPYDDTIYIKMLDGIEGNGFHVPVCATIDKLILTTPRGIDFGYITTHQITTFKFLLNNEGEVDAPYKWSVPEPFVFEPAEGIIPVGESHEISVSIFPLDASVFVSNAVCHVGMGVHAIIPDPIIRTELSAIGKYAYITLSENEVSFHEVVSGVKVADIDFMLRNESVVPAEFELVRLDKDRDEVFDVWPKYGVIPPKSEIPVTVSYNALAMGCFSLDRYVYITPAKHSTVLECRGLSLPPKVTLTKDISELATSSDTGVTTIKSEASPDFSLNFNDVEVGGSNTRLIYLSNHSHRDVSFSIICDEGGIFKISPKQGVVPAKFMAFPVTVVFAPPKPNNFYRRFFVLVGDALPLFYDCMGTGYIRSKGKIKEQRPAPIRFAHIQAYRNRLAQKMGDLSPDEIDEMWDRGANGLFFAQTGVIGTRPMSVTALQRPVTRTGESIRTLVAPAHEFFISDSDSSCKNIVINKGYLDFGYSANMSVSISQTVTIYNNTHSKVMVDWQVPVMKGLTQKLVDALTKESNREKDIQTEDRAVKLRAIERAFAVSPAEAEINPGKSLTFDVTFNPKQLNRNFVSQLEAYCYFKNQRTFRLVNDHSLVPPWCLTVNAEGHTFSSGQLQSKASLGGGNTKGGKLVFPCCYEGESIYQTFVLRNYSDLPYCFEMKLGFEEGGPGHGNPYHGDETFSVKPMFGEVDAEDFVLICVRFNPKATKRYVQLLRCMVNGQMSGKLMLEGAGAVPFLLMPDLIPTNPDGIPEQSLGLSAQPPQFIPKGPQGMFYIKPTCVGLSTSQPLVLKNGSRLPLKFKIHLVTDGRTQGIMSISPMAGILKGNDSITLSVAFAPRAPELYDVKLQVFVYPIGGKAQRVIDANQPGTVVAPELIQSLTVQLVANGEVSALIFDPSRLTVDVKLVNSMENKDIFLENVSDSDLQYQLEYKEEFTPDSASRNTVREDTAMLPMRHVPSTMSPVKPGAYRNNLFCEAPTGILPARSRTRIKFTYMPQRAGLFEFLIYARVQAIDRITGKPSSISNDEAALLRLSQTQREGQYDIEGVGASSMAMLPLMTNITARAAYPKLLFEDIRTDVDTQISDVEHLWKRFFFAELNYDLAIPMTLDEIRLFQSSSPDLSRLPRYQFEFAPAVVNSPLQTVMIRVRNNGFLTSSFHMHLPNEKTLELEQWCDEDEPSAELNRIVSIIEELKCFTVTPMHAVLEPGEVVTLTVSYQHSSLKYGGLHDTPILVKLDNGKNFYIDLIGRTLPAPPVVAMKTRNNMASKAQSVRTASSAHNSVASIVSQTVSMVKDKPSLDVAVGSGLNDILLVVVVGKDKTVALAPVPVGLPADQAPRQRTELINVSGSSIQYEVNKASLDEISDQNFHLPVVKCTNPTGVIPAGGSVFLEWYFYPLEVKPYFIPVSVKYSSYVPTMGFPTRQFDASAASLATPKSALSARGTERGQSARPSKLSASIQRVISAAAPAAAPPNIQYLDFVLKTAGYDPRVPRPIIPGSGFDGGLPPTGPLLKLPGQCVMLSEDLLDFQLIPMHSSARRMLILTNHHHRKEFEYVIDESSCVLNLESLLVCSPTFGRVPPKGVAFIDFVFTSNSLPLIFEERIKIMVREVMRPAVSRRGGRLMDKIKKVSTAPAAEHGSVISRNTVSRQAAMEMVGITHQVVLSNRVPTIPITVDQKGAMVVSKIPSLIPKGGGHNVDEDAMSWEELKESGHGNVVNMIDVPGSTRSRGGNTNLNLFDLPESPGAKSRITRAMSPQSTMMSARVGSPPRGAGSPSGRGQSPGTPGRGSFSQGGQSRLMTGNTVRSAITTGRSGADLFGVTHILIVRLKGEVSYMDTTQRLLAGKNPNQPTDASSIPAEWFGANQRNTLAESFIMPVSTPFIAPLGVTVSTEPKARVNISHIKHRDAELRNITETLVGDLLRNVLNCPSTKTIVADTLSGKRSPVNDSDVEAPSVITKTTYGVYFNEITTVPALHKRVILAFKRQGLLGYDTSGFQRTEELSRALHGVPQQWRGLTGEMNLPDEYTYRLTVYDLREALRDIGVTMIMNISLYRAIERNIVAQAQVIPGMLAFDLERNEIIAKNNLVCISSLVYSLSDEVKMKLDKIVNAVMDKKRFDEKVTVREPLVEEALPEATPEPETTPEGLGSSASGAKAAYTVGFASRPSSAPLPQPPATPQANPPKPGSPSFGSSRPNTGLGIQTDFSPLDAGSEASAKQEEVNRAFRKNGFLDTAQTVLAQILFDAIKSANVTKDDAPNKTLSRTDSDTGFTQTITSGADYGEVNYGSSPETVKQEKQIKTVAW